MGSTWGFEVRPLRAPFFGQADGAGVGELDEGQRLAARDEVRLVGGAADFEGAMEPDAFEAFEPAVDDEVVTEPGGPAVVDFGAEDDGELLALGHGAEVEAESGAEPSAAGFDEPEVGDIVDDAAGIGVEKHDFLVGIERGGIVGGGGGGHEA